MILSEESPSISSPSVPQLVVDWLEQSARASLEQFPVKVSYFADSVSWENTLHDITHGIDSRHIVTEMVRRGWLGEALLHVIHIAFKSCRIQMLPHVKAGDCQN